jgi:hypothetical protein
VWDGTQWTCEAAKSQRIVIITCPPYNAVGDGVTDNSAAWAAAIEDAKNQKAKIIFSPGRFLVANGATAKNAAGVSYDGLSIECAGWSAGATPATNRGTWIEYTGTTGSVLTLEGTAPGSGFLNNVVIRDCAFAATNAAYAGVLLSVRGVQTLTVDRSAFWGQEGVPLVDALIGGEEWINVVIRRSRFRNAISAVRQIAGGGWSAFWIQVKLEDNEFNRTGDFSAGRWAVEVSAAERITLTGNTFEPDKDGDAAGLFTTNTRILNLADNWTGDATGAGTWLDVQAVPFAFTNNEINGTATGICLNLKSGSRMGRVTANRFRCGTGILYAAVNPVTISDNFFIVPTNGFGIDVTAAANLELDNNSCDKESAATGTTCYRLGAATLGTLRQQTAGSADTNVTDNSAGGWAITTAFQETVSKLVVGSGTPILKVLSATGNIDFNLSANSCSSTNVSLTGVVGGDTVMLGISNGVETGISFTALSGTDVVTVRACNVTTSPIDPANRTFRVTVVKF